MFKGALMRGTQESAWVNNIIVITKVTIVLMVIVLGWGFINPANHTPFIPDWPGRAGFEDTHMSVSAHAKLAEKVGEGAELTPAGPLVEGLRISLPVATTKLS